MRQYSNYLCFLKNARWNGASGYKFFNDIVDALNNRGYDFEARKERNSRKWYYRVEYHHDRPTGHPAIIIGLTSAEYNKLKWACFDTIEDFADKYFSEAQKPVEVLR